jgi:hypothetical protein
MKTVKARFVNTPVRAMKEGTVRAFLILLTSKLTQYDMRLSAKDGNIYRLGHLLNAANKVHNDVKSYLERDDAEAMSALKASLGDRFLDGFSPVKAVIKAINAWLTDKKFPKLTIMK